MTDDSRYILAKKIARGGMAEIYLGKQVGQDGFQRLCAIKRILPHYGADQEFIQMFRDEAHICKRLAHANIVRVEGFEEVDGSYAIIMEYVDGADLRTLLHAVEQAKKRMPLPMACFIIAETARGLHFAHTKVDEITQQALGIVHRDVSPQNILVSFEGEVKITDFGIADAESKLTETRPGIVKGKYSYMSPEQISAKPVDCRTDIFALSIVLWEMLAMRRLFHGENEVDTIQRVKNCRIDVELRDLNKEVDEELDLILRKGLAKDPKKRYKSAGDFEKDLRRYMSRKFPDFTPEDLGDFLKKNMESRRSESAADIKKTLTETNLRPGKKTNGNAPGVVAATGSKGSSAGNIDLTLDEGAKNSPIISIQRPLTGHNRPALAPAANRPPASNFSKINGTHGNRQTPFINPRRQSSGGKTWLYALIAVLAMAATAKVFSTLNAQSQPAMLSLRTQPSRVRVSIDGRPVNEGRYVRATSKQPLRLPLRPGSHELVVSRPGYHSYKWNFTLDGSDQQTKDDIVLKELSPLAALKVKMRPADKRLNIDINSSYFVASLIPGRLVAVAPDVQLGRPYRMKVSSEDGSEFTCRFTPKASSWRRPEELVIDRRARKCTVVGP